MREEWERRIEREEWDEFDRIERDLDIRDRECISCEEDMVG